MYKFSKVTTLLFGGLIVLSFILSFGQILQVNYSKELIDNVTYNIDNNLIKDIVLFVLSITLCLVTEYFRKLNIGALTSRITHEMRCNITNYISNKCFNDFTSTNIQEYITVFNKNIEEISELYFLNIPIIFYHMFSLIVYTFFLMSLNYILAIIILLTNIITVIIPYFFSKQLQKRKGAYLNDLKDYNVWIGDYLKGQFSLRVNLSISLFRDKLNNKAKQVSNRAFLYAVIRAISTIVTGLFSYLGYIVMFIVGIILISKQIITIGELSASIMMSDLLVSPALSLTDCLIEFNSIKKVKSELDNSFSEAESIETYNIDAIKLVEFSKVHFSFDSFSISDFSFKFEKGKKYLIYGESGSGKSTIFKLITGQVTPDKGIIKINDIELQKIAFETYYEKMGIVFQDFYIFNDTLLNNITLGRKVDNSQIDNIIELLKLQYLKKEIYSERKYSENQLNLSGGERQKLNLARVLVKNNDFIILDEATSSIDTNSSNFIISQLMSIPNIGLINIEHKINPSHVQLYDEIIIIKSGKIQLHITNETEKEKFIHEIKQPQR